ncbi:hypothetical protein CCR97_28025 [Rhodoplanes elegans]|uniref:Glycosyltransferase 2-like domain-containing protein n=1 Tax=Rhodoplanes elegans TaxID=29408 RepID=A0A327JWF6_9BRAD|nr:glycosyltransferase [Rhodoplanes elegans]MBK5962016.1 hypothetical protein [Rhodoplanes elegans]RAI30850.1 hypothetical protein CH338_26910 [Rhodoplanes elegans]
MLSVVIPTRDCERALVRTLAVLVGAAVAGAVREVIVADGGSQDETTKVAEIAGCNVQVSPDPPAARLRAAATAARASWLLFLRPGAMPDPAWAEEAIRVVEDLERRGTLEMAAVFRIEPAGNPSLGGQAMALLREAVRRRPSPDQGLLIGRRFYDSLGGHPDGAAPEEALLDRIGRRRLIRLRSGITGGESTGI